MQTYILNLENNLPLILPALMAGIAISCLLLALFMSIMGRSKTKRLRAELEAESLSVQNEFNNQLELKTKELDEAKKDLQEANTEISHRIPKLVDHIKTHNEKLSELNSSLAERTQSPPINSQDIDFWAESLWENLSDNIRKISQQLDKESTTNSDLNATNEVINADLAKTNAENWQLQQTLAEQSEKLASLENDASDNQITIAQLKESTESLLTESASIKTELESKIQALNSENNELKQNLQQSSSEVQTIRAEIEEQQKSAVNQSEKDDKTDQQLNEKSEEIKQLQLKLAETEQLHAKTRSLEHEIAENNQLLIGKLEKLIDNTQLDFNLDKDRSLMQQFDGLISQISQQWNDIQNSLETESAETTAEADVELKQTHDTSDTQTEENPAQASINEKHNEEINKRSNIQEPEPKAETMAKQSDTESNLEDTVKEQLEATTEKVKLFGGQLKEMVNQKISEFKKQA